jgi:hypothetical protein
VTGRWFSLGTPISSTNKTDRHDIAEILLKVALYTINQTKPTFHLSQVTDKLYHICCIEYTSPWTGFEFTTLMVIGTDCTGSKYMTHLHMLLCMINYIELRTCLSIYRRNLLITCYLLYMLCTSCKFVQIIICMSGTHQNFITLSTILIYFIQFQYILISL